MHTRFGLSVCMTVFLILSIILLLPTSRYSQLQRIPFGSTLQNYKDGLWNGWGKNGTDEDYEDEGEDRVRLVVFGDSSVDDTVEEGQIGKGMTWVDVLCEEVAIILPPR